MTSEITRFGHPVPPRRWSSPASWFGAREHRSTASREGLIRLASSDRLVDVYDVLDRPVTGLVAVEDACWQFAVEDWRKRKPRFWCVVAVRTWREEGQRLDDKRQRVVELSNEIRTVRRAG